MRKAVISLVIGVILIIAGMGYTIQLINNTADSNFTLLFLLNILIVYLLVENIKLK